MCLASLSSQSSRLDVTIQDTFKAAGGRWRKFCSKVGQIKWVGAGGGGGVAKSFVFNLTNCNNFLFLSPMVFSFF